MTELDHDYPYSDSLDDDLFAAVYGCREQLRELLEREFRHDSMLGPRWRSSTRTTPTRLDVLRGVGDDLATIARDLHATVDDLTRRARTEVARDRTWRR